MTQKSNFKTVELPDGTQAYVMSDEQVTALSTIINNQIWWDGAWLRAKRVSGFAAAGVLLLMTLSTWLPWLTNLIRALTKDMPID